MSWAGGEASRTGWRPGTPHGWQVLAESVRASRTVFQNPCDHAGAGGHYQNPVAELRWLPSTSVSRQAGKNGGLASPVHTRIDRRQHSATTHQSARALGPRLRM